MLPALGPLWPLLGRSLMLNAASGTSRAVASTYARELAKDLIIGALERGVNTILAQSDFAKRAGNRTEVLDQQAGTVELISRILEKLRNPEIRNPGASYLAESLVTHHLEGGKQKTTSILAMNASLSDDDYYPLLVYATAANSRPVIDTMEAAVQAALLWAFWHNEERYIDMKDDTNVSDVLEETVDTRTYWQWLSGTWVLFNDPYSPKLKNVVEQMRSNAAWLRLGHFVVYLRRVLENENPGATLAARFDPVGLLNFAINYGSVVMADDRMLLNSIPSGVSYDDAYVIAKDMNYPLFRSCFLTSIAGQNTASSPTNAHFATKLAEIGRGATMIICPDTRRLLSEALVELAEKVKRDFT